MPEIRIEQPGVPLMAVDLSEGEVTFGRADDNRIVLVADEVSRHHAKIHLRGADTILEDLQSLNGTYVNRQRIVERVLSDEDEVLFGSKCRAVFVDDPEPLRQERAKSLTDSALARDLVKIKEEMDQFTSGMTMVGQAAQANLTMAGAAPSKLGDVEMTKLSRAFNRLDALYRASNLLASDFDLEKRMIAVLDLAMEVTKADRGFLMMREEGTEDLSVQVARAMGGELGESSPSMGIARRAAIEGEPVLMGDSGDDAHFSARESIIQQAILSAMCVPLRVEERILGSLYVDSRRAGNQFANEDLELFQALANQSAMAIDNVRLYEQMLESEKKRANLGRFLSPSVVEVIMNHDTELVLGGKKCTVTTLFCDIRGFTPMSEGLTPDELIELLNEHFTAMTNIVFEHQGTLDKYNGDEVMALFGAPISSDSDAQQAVRAAIAMQARNAELNGLRAKNGSPTFEMGIGINTGEVTAGYVGHPDRMDFTVLGDHVNVARRFCSTAGEGQIVTGESTYALVKDIVETKSIGTPKLKGKSVALQAYEILGLKANVK